jgi:putative ABC transport system ATP-binding protein
MIRLVSAGRTFGDGAARATALEDVTFEIRAGEFVALAGPSGSGKTSLLNLIGALDDPTAGRVEFDAVVLASLGEAERAELRLGRIGFVFQEHNLVPVLTAAENVELPLLFRRGIRAGERARAVAQALDRVGLAGKHGRRPAELSVGERQRVAVARAVAGRPDCVLADEPTANLDHETGSRVIGLLRALNREDGTTVVFATHDAELIALADRVVRLRDGRVESAGA